MKKIISLVVLSVSLFFLNTDAEAYYDYDFDFDQSELLAYESYDSFPYELIYQNLTVSDLYGLNCWDLRVLRNAIYAYHGYIFKSDDLRYHFNQFSWYRPRYKSESKVYGMMSKTEKHNIEIIKKRERQLGC